MMSKISSIRLIAGEMKRKAYMEVLTALILLCMMPGYAMIRLESSLEYEGHRVQDTGWIREFFPGLINGGTVSGLLLVIGALAIALVAAEFGYLHSREKLDFYHSLPLKREKIFIIRYLSGFFIFLIPYVICAGITILEGTIYGIMNGTVLIQSLQAMVGGIAGFLLIYHVGIVGMMLCGQTITGIIASGVLLIYFGMVGSLFSSLGRVYFASYSDRVITTIMGKAGSYLSPGTLYYRTLLLTAGQEEKLSAFLILAIVGMILLLFGIGMLLHRRYPSEAAGKALAYPRFAPLIKILVCVPAGLTGGLFFNEYITGVVGIYGQKWVTLLSVGITAILCMVVEFIYHKDIKRIFLSWRSSLITIGAVCVILFGFSVDLFGYDTYLPSDDKIESISFYPYALQSYFEYPDYENMKEIKVSKADKETVLTLAKEGIENLQNGLNQTTLSEETEDTYVTVEFEYKMKSGRTIQRCYVLTRQDALNTLENLCEKEQYRKQVFPIFSLEYNRIAFLNARNIEGKLTTLDLSQKQKTQLLDAYKKDVLNTDIQELDQKSAIGELSVMYTEEQTEDHLSWDTTQIQEGIQQIGSFYIYDHYINTISCLKKFGLSLQSEINPDDVNSITVYDYEDSNPETEEWASELLSGLKEKGEETDGGRQYIVTDPEEIQYLLKHMTYGGSGIMGGLGKSYSIYANIVTVYGSSDVTYYLK